MKPYFVTKVGERYAVCVWDASYGSYVILDFFNNRTDAAAEALRLNGGK